MTIRKHQNSILVLATLGVYLGLVLVGATPQVLAQAAMTKQFDLRDETEMVDDLDNKPDELPAVIASEDLFVSAVADLSRDLSRLSQQKDFSWDTPRHITVEDLSFCESDNSPSYLGSGEITPEVQRVFEKAAIRIGRNYFRLSSSLGIGKYHDGWPAGVSLDLNTSSKGLELNIKFVTKNSTAATILISEINRNFNKSPVRSGQKIVLENTKSKVSESAVILDIHLPRAGLDSLLAADAK